MDRAHLEVMYLAIRKSGAALLALSFFILLVLAIASTLLFFAERGEWNSELGLFVDEMGDPSQFSSIPLAAWFAVSQFLSLPGRESDRLSSRPSLRMATATWFL